MLTQLTAMSLALWSIGLTCLIACGGSPAAPARPDQDQTVIVTWAREGGFAGFCDKLEIAASGSATASSCKVAAKTRTISASDLQRLNDWRNTFGAVSISSSDPGTADSLTLKLTLAGKGSTQPSESQRQELLDWAQRIYTQTVS